MKRIRLSYPQTSSQTNRTFYYGFREKGHTLVVEQQNEFGQGFGPKRAEKLFTALFDRASKASPALANVSFSITTIPEDDAVEKILSLNRLRKLTIKIVRPNPAEDLFDEEAKILKKLEEEHAKSETIELIKAPGALALTPSTDTRQLAIVASRNGSVEGEGKNEEGVKLIESTNRHPKQVSYLLVSDSSAEVQFLNHINSFEGVEKST